MQKKYLLIPLIALTVYITPTFAASPSPTSSSTTSPSPSSASDAEITQNLKKKIIENLDKETEASMPPRSPRAYVGVVKDIIKDTLIMQDKDGKKDIKLGTDTNIIRSPGNAVIKAENIRIDDYIIAIGYPDGDDTLTGRRLIVSIDPIKAPEKTSGLGTIAKIGKTSITLKLEDKDQVVDTTTKTIYKSSVGTIESTDLSVGDTVIYTALSDDHNELTATVIMRTQTASISE
jgi:hypothetical protein